MIFDNYNFNQKVEVRKLRCRKKFLIVLEDKLLAKKKAMNLGIPTPKVYWSGKDMNTINFDMLPDYFVIKTNHWSGKKGIMFSSKENLEKNFKTIKEHFHKVIKTRYSRKDEWATQKIQPTIYVEEYVESDGYEFKIFAFNGKTEYITVYHKSNNKRERGFYDKNFKRINFEEKKKFEPLPEIEKPKGFDKILDYSKRFGKGIDFVRIDFFMVDGYPIFGESTCYPVGGNMKMPEDMNQKMGKMWKLKIN